MGERAETGAIRRIASTRMPTKWGLFKATGYVQDVANGSASAAVAITLGDPTTAAPPLLRIHAQCFTGEILGSLRCDCGEQLAVAMQAIAEEGRGLVIYEYQEGRGIGLMAKMQAYEMQDQGLDTIEANHALGFDTDYRDYRLPVAILRDLGIDRVRLLSNSPDKMHALSKAGISVVARVPCEGTPNPYSRAYLKTKKEKLGHALELASANVNVKPSARWNKRPRRSAAAKRSSERQAAQFASIERAIADLRAGRMVVVVDDEHRENEGDLTMAAEMVTPEAINFMATHGKGLVCLAMTGDRLDELRLGPMVRNGGALGGTAFTVSIDARGDGMTTGISAHERARTIKAAIDASTRPDDFARPGHVFPLRARDCGVLERRGHTEAAADLARLAGFVPAGVICEIVNDDGTMARVPDLVHFCTKHELIMVTVADLVRYRVDNEHESRVGVSESTLAVPQEEWLAANRASPAASGATIDELRQEFSPA
jgi:3,4-dihydroxy-2-butanone 4-phosphate synthase/GTP cyclohydrolase II